jgi:hypothetical protein
MRSAVKDESMEDSIFRSLDKIGRQRRSHGMSCASAKCGGGVMGCLALGPNAAGLTAFSPGSWRARPLAQILWNLITSYSTYSSRFQPFRAN